MDINKHNLIKTNQIVIGLAFIFLLLYFQMQTVNAINFANIEDAIYHKNVEEEHIIIDTLRTSIKINEGDNNITLRAGTAITLQTTQQISSQYLVAGQNIDFRVVYDVIADSEVVIPAGSIAKGTVVHAQKPKMFGKPGVISIKVNSVQAVDGQQIPLSSNVQMREGQNQKAIAWGIFVVSLFILWPLIFVPFFIKGKNAVIPQGLNMDASTTTNAQIEI